MRMASSLSASDCCCFFEYLGEDPEFRERVRDAVDRDDVGEPGWLLLERPDGWEERLDGLLTEAVP